MEVIRGLMSVLSFLIRTLPLLGVMYPICGSGGWKDGEYLSYLTPRVHAMFNSSLTSLCT